MASVIGLRKGLQGLFKIEYQPVSATEEPKELEIGAVNGYLGDLKPGKLTITFLKNKETENVVVFTLAGKGADGAWKIGKKKNFDQYVDFNTYTATVIIKLGDEAPFVGVPHTEYPENGFRLIEYNANGEIFYYNISVASQNGKFFFFVQLLYHEQCWTNKGRVICNAFLGSQWLHMQNMLSELLHEDNLPITRPITPPVIVPEEKNTAVVLWFNGAEGIGVIRMKTKAGTRDARIHWNECISPMEKNAPVIFNKGDLVTYRGIQEIQSFKKSGFTHQAYGVQKI